MRSIEKVKPMTIILIGAILVVIGGLVGAIGTFKHNKNSSAKTDRIEKGVFKTDLSVAELKVQNDSLLKRVESQSLIIDKLRQENNDLSSKLTEKTTNIYELNKTIKFPLPSKIFISYSLIFELNKQDQKDIEIKLNSMYNLNDGVFNGIDPSLIKGYINSYIDKDLINVSFLKDYKDFQPNILIINFSNSNTIFENRTRRMNLAYNPSEKKFMMIVENEELFKTPHILGNIHSNLLQTSVFDLANSTMQFIHFLPNNFKSLEIVNFYIKSKELNLHFPSLKSNGHSSYIGDVELNYN